MASLFHEWLLLPLRRSLNFLKSILLEHLSILLELLTGSKVQINNIDEALSSSSNPIAVSATTTSDYYDAFLNHRGSDVKETLATPLHQRLADSGLRVFLDKEELQEGDNIPSLLKATIRSAAVHIAIFSTNYAESTWCLNELLLMLESGKPIIPIFYGVKPSELRHALRETGRHLDRLEKKSENRRYDPKTVKEWREALHKASNVKGFEVEAEACKSYDMQLLDKIVKRVLEKLPKTLLDVSKSLLHVSKYPTGLDDKIEDFQRTVLMPPPPQSGKTRVVGIAGLGGVGKTTLAKEFFNRESSKYDRSCFLPDVREKAANRSLNSLQSILLEQLTGSKVKINSIDEGIGELRQRLSSSRPRALIILDDVDDIDQLYALLFPLNKSLPLGCVILVTSRNKDVLTSFGIVATSIYKLEGLHRHHSRELFCSHAFNQPYPVEGFEELVGSFLDACHGLPLSLQVIGALLRGNDLNHWKAQWRKISEILPDDIQAKLRISYDSLDFEEKHIFLDIACIFIGEDRDTAIRLWDESGWEGWLGLWKLENRCLVEFDSKNCIRMHDHLRDLGRYLGEKEPPGRELRIRLGSDDSLQNLSSQSPVRAISLVHGNGFQQSFENLAGCHNLSRLKLLRVQGEFANRVFSAGNFPQLIYLRWENLRRFAIPSCIRIKNLRVLYIEGDYMETLWQHEDQAPLQLRELYINARLLDVPEFIWTIKHLEKFVLHFSTVKTLPYEFGYTRSLKHVDLKGCKYLTQLPDSFGLLTSLQSLDLSECSTLQALPESVGSLTSLQTLDLSGCSILQALPKSVAGLIALQHFELSGCSNLKMLPDSFGGLTNLRHVNLSRCSNLEMLPDSFGGLTNLHHVNLSECSSLHKFPSSLKNLKNLRYINLSNYSNLVMLPYSFGNLRNLQHINLSGCSNLQMLPNSLENMQNLKHIDLSRCSKLQMLPNFFGNLSNLQHLDLSWCSNLKMLPNTFGNLTRLQHVDLSWCSSLPILPKSFGNLIQLKHLCLRKCYDLTISSETLGKIRTLEWLEISGCYRIEVLPPQVAHQRFLREMYLFCPFLKELPSDMKELCNLKTLHLASSCLDLLEIETLVSLEDLRTRECVKLKRIQGLSQLTKLRRLDVAKCSELEQLEGVESLRSLVELDASECPNLQWSTVVMKQLREQLKESLITH